MNPVHVVGAGPGAADLLTLRAVELLRRADVVLYPGTYLDAAVLGHCRDGARLVDTAGLDIDAILGEVLAAAVNLVNPALVAIGLLRRNVVVVGIGCVGCLIAYMVDAQKAALALPNIGARNMRARTNGWSPITCRPAPPSGSDSRRRK